MNKAQVLYSLLFTLCLNFSLSALAMDHQILARSFQNEFLNMPAFSYMTNMTAVHNDRGDIAMSVFAARGDSSSALSYGLWVRAHNEENGRVIYWATDNYIIPDITLTRSGLITFMEYSGGDNGGVFTYNINSKKVEQILSPKQKLFDQYYYPFVSDSGDFYLRAKTNRGTQSIERVISESESKSLFRTDQNKNSYIFRPRFNSSGEILLKLRKGLPGQIGNDRPNHIVRGKSHFSIIADDLGEYTSILNSTSMSESGVSVMKVKLKNQKVAIILIKKNGDRLELTREGSGDLLKIEAFAPDVNDHSVVVFRGIDQNKQKSLFLVDKDLRLKKILSPGDLLETDEETGRLYSGSKYSPFTGGVSINNKGEIVFHCTVESKNGERFMGEALYLLKL